MSVAAFAAPFASTCPEGGKVSLHVNGTPLRIVLRDISAQGRINIAIDPGVKGHIKANFDCVDPHDALRWVLPQAYAEFCVAGNVLRISREGTGACAHPEPVVDHIRTQVP